MKAERLAHRFMKSIPDELEPGMLYVSIAYDSTIHLCACGCGNQVVLPLHPTAWRLTYDGEAVTMTPSIGNWGFPCRSHYIIERGRIRWASERTDAQIADGRQRTLNDRVAAPGDCSERSPTGSSGTGSPVHRTLGDHTPGLKMSEGWKRPRKMRRRGPA